MGGVTKTNIWLQYSLHFVALLGLLASVYSLIVELHMEFNPGYSPMCDFNSAVSCSKAFMSKWGKGFGLVAPLLGDEHWLNQKNPVFGILFYCVFMAIPLFNSLTAANIGVWLAWASNGMSVYLAYILYFKVQALCVVCASLYVINFLLSILFIWRRNVLKQLHSKKKRH